MLLVGLSHFVIYDYCSVSKIHGVSTSSSKSKLAPVDFLIPAAHNTTSENSKITDETNYFTKLLGLCLFALLASALIGSRRTSRTGTNVALDTSSDGKFQLINLASQGVFWGEGANECSAKSNFNESQWDGRFIY